MPVEIKFGHKLKAWCTAVAKSAGDVFIFMYKLGYLKSNVVSAQQVRWGDRKIQKSVKTSSSFMEFHRVDAISLKGN